MRVFSGIKPSGQLHLGNYLGALRHFVADQHTAEAFYCVVDLHALTVAQSPAALRTMTLETAQIFLAAGLDPQVCTLFVQSHVPAHAELAWLMQCTSAFGELRRMVQFKDKAAGEDGHEGVSVGLFTYPTLMAADILLYRADRVPVGDDQRQHLELARLLAQRFNTRYQNDPVPGEATAADVFVVPVATTPPVAARVMDLTDPNGKMGKSNQSGQGVIYLLDSPDQIAKKIRRAVTDTENQVRFDPVTKPGVSNLLGILAATTGRTTEALAETYSQYGALKSDTADAVIESLRPLQERHDELSRDPGFVHHVIAEGAAVASDVAGGTLARAKTAIGLLERLN